MRVRELPQVPATRGVLRTTHALFHLLGLPTSGLDAEQAHFCYTGEWKKDKRIFEPAILAPLVRSMPPERRAALDEIFVRHADVRPATMLVQEKPVAPQKKKLWSALNK